MRIMYGIGYIDGAEPREKRIAELEKGKKCRTEKKLKPENCLKLLAKEGYIKFTSDQLTKAKELIKRLMYELVVSNRPYEEVELLVKDVEQFLREVEK